MSISSFLVQSIRAWAYFSVFLLSALPNTTYPLPISHCYFQPFFGFLFTLYYLPIQWEFTDSTTCTLFSSLLPLFYIPHLSVHQSYSLGESLSTYLESNFLCHNLSLHSQFLIS